MFVLALVAPFAAQLASPMPVAEADPAFARPQTTKRCALHHLQVPTGKSAAWAIMQCSDQPSAEMPLTMRDAAAPSAPTSDQSRSNGS